MTANKNMTMKGAAALALTLAAVVPACAQTPAAINTPLLSFNARTTKDPGRTLMLASAVVLLVGLADNDHTLEVIGAVGVLISMYDVGTQYYRHDVAKSGPWSIGVTTYKGVEAPRPSPYAQVTFKF